MSATPPIISFDSDAVELVAAAARVGIRDWMQNLIDGGCYTHGEVVVVRRTAARFLAEISALEEELSDGVPPA